MTDYNFDSPQDIAQDVAQQVLLNQGLYGDQRMAKMTEPPLWFVLLIVPATFVLAAAPFLFVFLAIHFKWWVR